MEKKLTTMTQKTKNQNTERRKNREKDNKVEKDQNRSGTPFVGGEKEKKIHGGGLNSLSHENSYQGNQDLRGGHQLL